MDMLNAVDGLDEESRMIVDLVAKFVDQELLPLEQGVLEREIKGQHLALTKEEDAMLRTDGDPLDMV